MILVSCSGSSLTKSGNRLEYLLGGFGPEEGFRVLVVQLKITFDRCLQFTSAAEGAAPDLLGGQSREEALDEIDPRSSGRREVNVEARTLGQPAMDQGGLVRPVVVHDQVDVETGRDVGVDSVEKLTELPRAMAAMTLADDGASLAIERLDLRFLVGAQHHSLVWGI